MNTLPLKAINFVVRPIKATDPAARPIKLPGYRLLIACTVFILSLTPIPTLGQAQTPQEGSPAVTNAPTLAQTKAPQEGSSVTQPAPAVGQG